MEHDFLITNSARLILDDEKNAYWRPVNNGDIETTLVDAVNFGDDAYFLAGPFNGLYGLVYIKKRINAKPISQLNEATNNSFRKSPIFYPYVLRSKIEAMHGQAADFWWNNGTRRSLSSIDIQAGASTDGYAFDGKQCSLFANTEEGIKLLFSALTDIDWLEAEKALAANIEEAQNEAERTCMHAEKPYRVHLQGTDDTSYGRVFSTMEDAKQLLADLHKYGFSAVHEQMFFTN